MFLDVPRCSSWKLSIHLGFQQIRWKPHVTSCTWLMPTELLMIKTCRWRVILPTRGYGISKKQEKWWNMSWRLPLARFSKEFCVSVVLLGCQMGRRGWWHFFSSAIIIMMAELKKSFSAPAKNATARLLERLEWVLALPVAAHEMPISN